MFGFLSEKPFQYVLSFNQNILAHHLPIFLSNSLFIGIKLLSLELNFLNDMPNNIISRFFNSTIIALT